MANEKFRQGKEIACAFSSWRPSLIPESTNISSQAVIIWNDYYFSAADIVLIKALINNPFFKVMWWSLQVIAGQPTLVLYYLEDEFMKKIKSSNFPYFFTS